MLHFIVPTDSFFTLSLSPSYFFFLSADLLITRRDWRLGDLTSSPLLGKSVSLETLDDHLIERGYTTVRVLATDRLFLGMTIGGGDNEA